MVTWRLISARRYPHKFFGTSDGPGSPQIHFSGAPGPCNDAKYQLLEYPVMKDGTAFPKDSKHGTVGTPARVVYLANGKILCGVITHVTEDAKDHHGSGPFRVCPK